VTHWTVRAVSERDAVMTFGLRAEGYDQAVLTALERLSWHPVLIDVQPVPERDNHERAV
jgi:hypothetical protein